jgi:hypothetical protein
MRRASPPIADWVSRGQWVGGTYVTIRDLHVLGLDAE